jgi:nucleoside-diphosphate-sugar epimerase
METILVTGGAGYLGSILIHELLKLGHQVTVLDNFMYGQSSLNHFCADENFKIIRGDIRNRDMMRSILKDKDIVIPLAALVGAPLCKQDPFGATSINHDGIMLMLELLSSEQKVLMPTTNSAYGTGNADNFCTENSALKPISQYAIEKVAVEKKLMSRKNAVSFRLATVFGMSPRMRLDLLVNDFVYRAVNDKFIVIFEGHFKRNYIHVRDVAKAFIHAINNFSIMNGEIYNVGLSNANISKLELCEVIKSILPDFTYIHAPIGKDPDQRNYIVSNAKIEATGYTPSVTLEAGIKELIKGYQIIKNTKYGNV